MGPGLYAVQLLSGNGAFFVSLLNCSTAPLFSRRASPAHLFD
jgi:hypothetical protein